MSIGSHRFRIIVNLDLSPKHQQKQDKKVEKTPKF